MVEEDSLNWKAADDGLKLSLEASARLDDGSVVSLISEPLSLINVGLAFS